MTHTDERYRIMEIGLDCGPVRSWPEILRAIDRADHGDGAPSVYDRDRERYLTRDEVAALAATP